MSTQQDDEDDVPMLVDGQGEPSNDLEDLETELNDILQTTRVPITIVTGMIRSDACFASNGPFLTDQNQGYLGAGKTTLLNYILNEKHGKKIAIILNG